MESFKAFSKAAFVSDDLPSAVKKAWPFSVILPTRESFPAEGQFALFPECHTCPACIRDLNLGALKTPNIEDLWDHLTSPGPLKWGLSTCYPSPEGNCGFAIGPNSATGCGCRPFYLPKDDRQALQDKLSTVPVPPSELTALGQEHMLRQDEFGSLVRNNALQAAKQLPPEQRKIFEELFS